MSLAENPVVAKPRRRAPPGQGWVIHNIENVNVKIHTSVGIAQTLDGLDRRIALLEESMPSIGMVAAQSGRLARLEEQAKNGGNGGNTHASP